MANTRVSLETSLGKMVIELFEAEAPITAANFLGYVFISGRHDVMIKDLRILVNYQSNFLY